MQPHHYPHLTAAVLITDRDDRALMVREIDNGINVWNQPAGHVEVGEDIRTAAVREALEESRYRVRLTHLVGLYQNRHPATGIHYLRFCFAAEAIELVENARLDADIEEADWLAVPALLGGDYPLRSPIVRQCLLDYQAGQRYPLDCIRPFTNPLEPEDQ